MKESLLLRTNKKY